MTLTPRAIHAVEGEEVEIVRLQILHRAEHVGLDIAPRGEGSHFHAPLYISDIEDR
jgi:hypothetical protein